MPETLIDGNWLRAEPVDSPRPKYQFRVNGDRVAAVFEQDYWQTAATFTPQEFGIPHETLRDFYLIAETDPEPLIAGLCKFTRTYARVPASQVTYGSRILTKPNASALGVSRGNYYNSQGASNQIGTAYEYSSYIHANNKIYGPVKVCSSAFSAGATHLTFGAAHGVSGSEQIVVYDATDNQVFTWESGAYTVVDSTHIDLPSVDYGSDLTGMAEYLRNYTPGTDRVGTRSTQKFYLPGVTSGITAPTDIPIPAVLLNDADFLASVVANMSGYQTYDASDLARWKESPIHTQTLEEINMADV